METLINSGYLLYALVALVLLAHVLLFIVWRRGRASARAKKESEDFNQVVVDHVADGVFIFDAETLNIVEVNASLCRSLGYEPSELKGRHVSDLVAHDKESIDENVGAVLGEGKRSLGERKYRRKDGEIVDFEVSAGKLFHDGRVVICAVARNVTERREIESRLKEAEERYRTLVEQIPAIVYIEDIETNATLYDSPQLESILGYSRDTYENDPGYWDSIVHPDDLERVKAVDHESVEKGHFRLEYRVYAKSGEVVWLRDEARLVRDEEERPRFWQGVIFDVTEQKDSEDALRESEERYRSIVDLSPNTLAVQSEGKFVYINGAGVEMFGAESEEEIVGRPVLDFVHEDYKKLVRQRMRKIDRGEATELSEQKWVRLDGGAIDIEAAAIPIVYFGERAAQIVLRDVTEQKRTEHETELRIGELSRSNAELEQFAYVISHDLRAPIRSLDGFSRILLEDYAKNFDEAGLNYLERIRNSADRMSRMIEELLDLSRLNRAEMRREEVDLSDIARSVASTLRSKHPDRRVEVIIAGGLLETGDERLLHEALSNLMDNAWKFTSRSPRPRVVFGMVEQGGEPVYFVRDNGVGFDMAHAGKLFGPFQRLHSDEDFEGSGVGLAAVSRIIDRHGGRVWAEGAVGQGATFYFTL